jgi:hypothetical protein
MKLGASGASLHPASWIMTLLLLAKHVNRLNHPRGPTQTTQASMEMALKTALETS